MSLWSTSLTWKRVFVLGVLAVLVGLLTSTLANGQGATAPATSTAPRKTTIQAAQQRLLALGYQPGAADGVMGARAIAALKKFQADRSLPVTGQLDRKTLDALDAESAKTPHVGLNQDAVGGEKNQPSNGGPKYRDLTKDDGLECHMYTTMISSLTSASSGSLSSGGRTFECMDASKHSTEIGLVAMRDLGNQKVAIVTKDYGTIYYRNDETCGPDSTEAEAAIHGSWHTRIDDGKTVLCADQDMYEMTDIQIKKLKTFLGL